LLGSVPDLGQKESCIPVLLVQSPGCFQTGSIPHSHQRQAGVGAASDFGSGWDVILPAGWAMAFWIAFIYRGAKAVGLREQRSLAFEAGELIFPDCCPDTPSGAKMNLSRAAELESAYNRRPPAKRCNYDKMGVTTPFHCPWLELVQEWMHLCGDGSNNQVFYCVRSRRLLQFLSSVCAGAVSWSDTCGQNSSDPAGISAQLLHCGPAVVKVYIAMSGRGAPSQLALICLPTNEDILKITHRKRRDRGDVEGPTEPLHRKVSNTTTSGLNQTAVLGSTDRPTVGFVVEGGFSHAAAKGSGVGFVSVVGLRKLLQEKPDAASYTHVLIRNTHSLQYRPAVLHVVV